MFLFADVMAKGSIISSYIITVVVYIIEDLTALYKFWKGIAILIENDTAFLIPWFYLLKQWWIIMILFY